MSAPASVPDPLLAALEGVLFVASRAMTVPELRAALGDEVSEEAITAALDALVARHPGDPGRGFHLARVGSAWQLRTTPQVASFVAPLTGLKPVRLSRAALETLAVVAYRQPCTRSDLERIRGVDSGGVLRALLDRKLLRIAGRKREPGRPMLYATTAAFLDQFSLGSLSDLPSLLEYTELTPDDLQGLPQHVVDEAAAAQLTLADYAARRAIEHLDAEVARRIAGDGPPQETRS